jgi:hypothetical protein
LEYTYILKCADGTYYTGHTRDIGERMRRHNKGENTYTKYRLPVELIFLRQSLVELGHVLIFWDHAGFLKPAFPDTFYFDHIHCVSCSNFKSDIFVKPSTFGLIQ